jgi:hypothetical protein
MLDVAGLRIELGEFLLRGRFDRGFVVEQDRAAGGGALVESEDVSRHGRFSSMKVVGRAAEVVAGLAP